MKNPLYDILHLFYPELCFSCEETIPNKKHVLCISCKSELPLTHFCIWEDNPVEQSFYGRVVIEAATSFLYFHKKSMVQQLIHQLKYKNQQYIGTFIGNWMGDTMASSKRFNNIDYIIPVPLHAKKQKQRGYNQVSTFGKSLEEKLKIPFLENVLVRISKSKTQTLKNRFERSKKLEEKFYLADINILKNKHILLIDDIITTGATLEACSMQLLQAPHLKISIATMAYTL